jgi:hypothetical protein
VEGPDGAIVSTARVSAGSYHHGCARRDLHLIIYKKASWVYNQKCSHEGGELGILAVARATHIFGCTDEGRLMKIYWRNVVSDAEDDILREIQVEEKIISVRSGHHYPVPEHLELPYRDGLHSRPVYWREIAQPCPKPELSLCQTASVRVTLEVQYIPFQFSTMLLGP